MKRLLHYFLITFTYLTCYSQNTIQISNGSATEGLPLTVMIRLNNSNENGALLNLTMTPGSANIRDYEGYSSILSFQPGETTKTLIVQTTNDDIEEENETFFVNVGFFGSSTVSSATMTIMDNDGEIKQPTAPITPIAPITPPCANAPRLTYRAIESPNNCGETGKIELTCQNLPNGEYIVNTNNNTSLTMNVVNNIGTIDNLSAGTYNNLTVTYNNCTSNNNINITIENPTPPSLILSKIINPTTCEGTGEIQLTCQNLPNGEYVISTNSNTSLTMNVANNMGTIDNVFVGTYNNLKVTYNNCSSNSNININIEAPEAPSLTLNKVTNPTTCEGTGEIQLISRNLPDGTYILNTNNNKYLKMNVINNIGTINNVLTGTYNNLRVTYNNCTSNSDINISINNPTSPSLTLNGVTNPSECNSTDGSITLNTDGLPNGTYTVNHDDGTLEMTVNNNLGNISNLGKGTYNNLFVEHLNCENSLMISTSLYANCAFTATRPTFSNIPLGTGYYINKLFASPPKDVISNTDDLINEYFEFIGNANENIPQNLYFIMIEGDGGSEATDMGKVKEAIQLGATGASFGNNGIFALTSDYHMDNGETYYNPYSNIIIEEAETLTIQLYGPGPVTSTSSSAVTSVSPNIGYDGNITDASATYMLIAAPSNPKNHDLDLDDDGQIDSNGIHTEWVLYDSVSYLDTDDISSQGEFGYGQVVFARNYDETSNQYHITEGAEIVPQGNANVSFFIRLGNEGLNHTSKDWVAAANAGKPSAPYWQLSTSTDKVSNDEFVGYQLNADDYGSFVYGPQATLSNSSFENEKLNISIYPNPAKNYIITSKEIDLISIYTAQGEKVKSSTNTKTDISNLATGMYFVIIEKDNKESSQVIIKQ